MMVVSMNEYERETHLSHCNKGSFEGTCKYGDYENCPALRRDIEITVDNGKHGKLHIAMDEHGFYMEDCRNFGTPECDECQHKFKCFTEKTVGGKFSLPIPISLKNLFNIIEEKDEKE